MSGIYQFPARGPIKSIQRGSVALSTATNNTTVTITAVNTAYTELRFLGLSTSTTTLAYSLARGTVTNSTTLTFTRGSSTDAATVSWELTEFYP